MLFGHLCWQSKIGDLCNRLGRHDEAVQHLLRAHSIMDSKVRVESFPLAIKPPQNRLSRCAVFSDRSFFFGRIFLG